MSDINWEEKYEKETGEDPTCWNIPYAGAKPEKNGMVFAKADYLNDAVRIIKDIRGVE